VLTGAVFIPVLGAVLIAFIPRQNEWSIKATALLTTLVTLGLGVYLIAQFDYDQSKNLQFVVNRPWIDRCTS
jgi:NADH:ubiquinone oxidoreductase subunit 4 (subunit M)